MSFKPIQKLNVSRTLSTGQQVEVGTLAQNRQGVYFQYHDNYLGRFGNLSPYALNNTLALQQAPAGPHQGLHGVFADSLPDGWGLLLQDRVFRQHGILPNLLTQMDRLAFVGQGAVGALAYAPNSQYAAITQSDIDLSELGQQAQAVFEGQTGEVLQALVVSGNSGGARPKALIYAQPGNWANCSTAPRAGDEAWLVKFTSASLPLGHEEGVCEAVYLQLAEQLQLEPPQHTLVQPGHANREYPWLALKRFDWVSNQEGPAGRLHMHSACGLLGADFRLPSLDYQTLISATRRLCKSPAAAQLQFRRAVFNLLASNQDDHSKNWAFLQNDQGHWQPAPFYDVTFSPHPHGEHSTAFAGFGKAPPLKAVQGLAAAAGFANWGEARQIVEHTVHALAQFETLAKAVGLSQETSALIAKQLDETRKANQGLLARS